MDEGSILRATLVVLERVWVASLLGAGLMAVGAGAGWAMAVHEQAAPVRFVSWWVDRWMWPRLRRASGVKRALMIYLNNMTILAVLIFLGRWHAASLAAVAAVGVSMGIGLRILARRDDALAPDGSPSDAASVRRMRLGLALNLLEPPVIVLALGLSLHRSVALLDPFEVWATVAVWIAPTMLVAAAGESLWMGVAFRARERAGVESERHGPPSGE
ncbi:MAG: hypothetical protein D6788_03295 [Planctomycetota bacterium]|nr:MAG: hypothetical protein D6788_03295 [Planctomycetota bacterium]